MCPKTEPVKDLTCLLSLHDVSPIFEDEVVSAVDVLDGLGIESYSLLVTPMYQMKGAASFEKHEVFANYLQSLGIEISMHGFSHQAKSGHLSEFKSMTSEQILSRLKRGIQSIQKSIGVKPFGFIPPLWESPQKVKTAAKKLGFGFCAIGTNIFCFEENLTLTTADPIVSQGEGKTTIVNSLFELEIGGAMQIALHPRDLQSSNLHDLLIDMKDRLGYNIQGYRDYIKNKS
ncbi:MAG: DUF2334 domain-containing protein [Candidatus Thorarchaeota archaeon]